MFMTYPDELLITCNAELKHASRHNMAVRFLAQKDKAIVYSNVLFTICIIESI